MATPFGAQSLLISAIFCLFALLSACAPPSLPTGASGIAARQTPDDSNLAATRAMETISAALLATASPAPPATDTPAPPPAATEAPATAVIDPAATSTALADEMATKVAATLTAQPTATPDLAATGTAQADQIATAIAATLTAQPTPTATGTTTPPPTATPDLAATATAQAGQVATAIAATLTTQAPAIPTNTPVPPPPTRVACAISVDPALAGYWRQDELGCAVSTSQQVWSSWTPFERGHTIWRRDTNTLYVLYNSGGWQGFRDEWDQVSEPPSRGAPPPGRQAPIRGSGWVWGTNDTVFQGLGWALDKQKGFCALVQTFEQGFILRSSTVEFCHEENLYNFAREPGFGFGFALVHQRGHWYP